MLLVILLQCGNSAVLLFAATLTRPITVCCDSYMAYNCLLRLLHDLQLFAATLTRPVTVCYDSYTTCNYLLRLLHDLQLFAVTLTRPATVTQNCTCCETLACATGFAYNADQLKLHNTRNMTQEISFACKTDRSLHLQPASHRTSFCSTVLIFAFGACLRQQLKCMIKKFYKHI
jgi:hypothetical protein